MLLWAKVNFMAKPQWLEYLLLETIIAIHNPCKATSGRLEASWQILSLSRGDAVLEVAGYHSPSLERHLG